MKSYRYIRDGGNVYVTRDEDIIYSGVLKSTIHTFGFTLRDDKGNRFELKAVGFFFWRRLRLYLDGEYIDDFDLYLDERDEMERSELVEHMRGFVSVEPVPPPADLPAPGR